jgi:hypothetical protein
MTKPHLFFQFLHEQPLSIRTWEWRATPGWKTDPHKEINTALYAPLLWIFSEHNDSFFHKYKIQFI